MAELLRFFSTSLHLRFNISKSPDGRWGARLPNGSYTGMLGMMARNEVDFALGPFAYTYDRSIAASYAAPLQQDGFTILTGRLRNPNLQFFGMLAAFEWEVWAFMLAAIFLLPLLCHWCVSCIADSEPEADNLGYSDLFWGFLTSLFGQGMVTLPYRNSGRLIVAAHWIAITILMNLFGGYIRASLLVRTYPIINTWAEFAESNIKPVIVDGSFVINRLQPSSNPIHQKIWNKAKNTEGSLLTIENFFGAKTLSQAVKGKVGMILGMEVSKVVIRKNCRNYTEGIFYCVKEVDYPYLCTMMIRKNLDPNFGRLLLDRVQRVVESGLVKHWKENAEGRRVWCETDAAVDSDRSVRALGLDEVIVMFIFLAFGISVAFLTLLMEMLFYRYKQRFI